MFIPTEILDQSLIGLLGAACGSAATAVWARYAREKMKGPPVPPSPDELARDFASALMASGKYDGQPGAAIHAAWWAVPHYYQGRGEYVKKIAPMYFNGMPAGMPVAHAAETETV